MPAGSLVRFCACADVSKFLMHNVAFFPSRKCTDCDAEGGERKGLHADDLILKGTYVTGGGDRALGCLPVSG